MSWLVYTHCIITMFTKAHRNLKLNKVEHLYIQFILNLLFSPMAQKPLLGQNLLIFEASESHSDTAHSVGFLWTTDQPDTETST